MRHLRQLDSIRRRAGGGQNPCQIPSRSLSEPRGFPGYRVGHPPLGTMPSIPEASVYSAATTNPQTTGVPHPNLNRTSLLRLWEPRE